jgi:hypothetical protein
MKKQLLGILIILMLMAFGEKEGVNFSPRSLIKSINKMNQIGNPVLLEMKIQNDNLSPTIDGKFFRVGDESDPGPVKHVFVGRVNSCRSGGCSSGLKPCLSETFEYFDYFVLFDFAGQVLKVSVYNYQATHGQEITIKGWLKQFKGYKGEKALVVGKDIDTISGATISVYGITENVQDVTKALAENLELHSTK